MLVLLLSFGFWDEKTVIFLQLSVASTARSLGLVLAKLRSDSGESLGPQLPAYSILWYGMVWYGMV